MNNRINNPIGFFEGIPMCEKLKFTNYKPNIVHKHKDVG